jgi:photosystem II stability/assembly factor-like uncharacterized protein
MKKTIIITIVALTAGMVLPLLLDVWEVNTHKKYDKATHAADYLKFRRKSREDSRGNIPMDGLLKAKEHVDAMNHSSRDAGLWEWDWLGPSNIGGRIRTILPDPNNSNKIWIGSVGGGIWKTTNGGSSWLPINDFIQTLSISSLCFDPSTTSIMYAGTGEGFGNSDALPGAGILKSTDSGVTWNQLASTNNDNFTFVNRLAAHPDPDSAGIIYAVTNANRVYKTEDGGITWDIKHNTNSDAVDIKIHPLYPEKIVVGCKRDVYLSLDYGETWQEQTTGIVDKLPAITGRCEVSFCLSNANRIYVSMNRNLGEIWSSFDNGDIWELKNTGTNYFGSGTGQGWYDNTIWVSPSNSHWLIVGGVDLFRSTDGGTTLTRISDWHDYHNGSDANSAHADQHCIVEASNYNQSTNPVVYFGNDGGIQKTNDVWSVSMNSGWENLANTSLGITQFFGGAASDDGSIIVGGTQDNDKIRYRESGDWSGPNNWYQAHTGDGGYAAVNNDNTDIVYGSYLRLTIKKSIDGGDSYFDAFTGILDQGNILRSLFINPLSMDPNDPDILVTGGSRIWRTNNAASSWVEIRSEIGNYVNGNGDIEYVKCSAIDIDDGSSARIWIGYDNGHVALTTNTGTNWDRVDNNGTGIPDRYITDIAINPNNSNQVVVTTGGYNADNVWYTPDAGQTWENISGTAPNNLPSIQVNTIRFHPSNSNWIYVGTDIGVFASQDKGQNWSVITNSNAGNGSEGPVNTEVSELFWQGNEFLIAATHGRGMYRTSTPPFKIYVDLNAAPGGDGSQSNPFKTIAEAADVAGPGATITIEAGIYNESEVILLQNEAIIFVTNGQVIIK